jgi:hypothetical protein
MSQKLRNLTLKECGVVQVPIKKKGMQFPRNRRSCSLHGRKIKNMVPFLTSSTTFTTHLLG